MNGAINNNTNSNSVNNSNGIMNNNMNNVIDGNIINNGVDNNTSLSAINVGTNNVVTNNYVKDVPSNNIINSNDDIQNINTGVGVNMNTNVNSNYEPDIKPNIEANPSSNGNSAMSIKGDDGVNNRVQNLSKIAFYVIAICIFSVTTIVLMFMAFSTREHKTIYLNESIMVDDIVTLKENNYYKEDYLKNQNKYITTLIDKINLDFSYNLSLSDMVDYDISYYADALLYIHEIDHPENVLWSEKETFIEKESIDNSGKNTFKLDKSIEIDYNKYDQLVKDFIKDYVLITDSKLKIDLHIVMDCVDSDYSDEFDYEKVITVEIPMNEQTISLVKSYDSLKNASLDTSDKTFNMFSIVYLVFGIGIGILDLIFLYNLYVILRDNAFKRTAYQKLLDKILRTYDHIIVSAKVVPNFEGLSVIEVNRFEELLDAQEELRIPIVHCEVVKDNESVFVIINNNNAWVYYLKESN